MVRHDERDVGRMTQDEFRKFYKYITAATTSTNPSPEKTQVYWDALNDLDFEVAMVGAKRIIATLENPFLPMPAVFRNSALEATGKETLPWPDAYDQVLKAISNFGVHRTEQAMNSLTPINQAAMRALGGFQAFCANEENDVNRAQFRMAYEALAKREMQDAKTPQKLKDLMTGMKDSPMLKLVEPFSQKAISALDYQEDDKTDEIEDIDARSKHIREMLAMAVKNRRKEPEFKQEKKMEPGESEKFYL